MVNSTCASSNLSNRAMALPTFLARSQSLLQIKSSNPIGTFKISTPSGGCRLTWTGKLEKEASPVGHQSSHFLSFNIRPRSRTELLLRKSRICLSDSLSLTKVPSSRYHACSFRSGQRRQISLVTRRRRRQKNSGPRGSPCCVPLCDSMTRPLAHNLECSP